jgi:hypothetical protein
MNLHSFQMGLRALSTLLPYGKKITDEEALFTWALLDDSVKATVTDEMWAYACAQRRMDPNPDKELSLDIQLLRYVYRIRDGQPAFDWGLKQDLPQRMALRGQFHPPALIGDPTPAPQQLPASNPVLEGLMNPLASTRLSANQHEMEVERRKRQMFKDLGDAAA